MSQVTPAGRNQRDKHADGSNESVRDMNFIGRDSSDK